MKTRWGLSGRTSMLTCKGAAGSGAVEKGSFIWLLVAALASSVVGAGCSDDPVQREDTLGTERGVTNSSTSDKRECRQQCAEQWPNCARDNPRGDCADFKACRKACRDDPDDGNGSGGGGETVYTTESAPDLDTSDRLDFKKGLLEAGYKDLGDTKRCTLSEFNSLLGRSDIKVLYHSSHGNKGLVALSDKDLTCQSSVQYQVENVIFATCLTLTDTCWKSKMGRASNGIFGYTKVSFDGYANDCAKKMASGIKEGQSYIKAWYAANTAVSKLKDRWCAYVREGGNIVEYSARSGNTPRFGAGELEPMDTQGIVFIDSELLRDTRAFYQEFIPLQTVAYRIETGGEPDVTFHDSGTEFLKKNAMPAMSRGSKTAQSFAGMMPPDAQLEDVMPIEADGTIVAQRIRYNRVLDNLEVRANGMEHHEEIVLNGNEIAAQSEYWPKITRSEGSRMSTTPLMTVQDTASELALDLLSIARAPVAIVQVKPCYGSPSSGEVVPAHCFSDTDGSLWVVNAYNGDLVK